MTNQMLNVFNRFQLVAVFVLLSVAYTLAAPNSRQASARRALPAVHHAEVHDEFNQYHIQYVTAEGTVVSERGRLVPTADGLDSVMVVEGEVSYVGDDGKTYSSKYTAGLDGFQIQGDHLPVPPAVPEA
jgi:hypothetical protein